MSNPPKPPPFKYPDQPDKFVNGLVKLVGGHDLLDIAVKAASYYNIPQMLDWGISDADSFLRFASGMMLNWIPHEDLQGKDVYWVLCLFYFILDQPPINGLQIPINPVSINEPISSISQWIVTYAQKVGERMNSTASLTADSLQSFYDSPNYNLKEAVIPPGGFKTFNQLFARQVIKGSRPIDGVGNDKIVTWPTDSTFEEAWTIQDDSIITLKHLDWPISALLQGSDYANEFAGGTLMHAFLGPNDYHRQHAPVSGDILEAYVIQGLAYLEVDVVDTPDGPSNLVARRTYKASTSTNTSASQMNAEDGAGYQFLQTRGLIIIQNPTIGKVAVLPIGMAQVSSVSLFVQSPNDPGKRPTQVTKGDEISTFLFGGSDIVLVFQKDANFTTNAEKDQHYSVGQALGNANPTFKPK